MSVEPSQFRRLAVRTGLRLALALLIGAAFAAIFRREIIRALLPLFFWEITWLGDDFRILGIALQNVAGDSYIGVAAELARPLFGNGKMLSPGSDVSMSVLTLSGYVLEVFMIFFGVIVAWPAENWRLYLSRFLLGMPVLLAALMIDVPLVLLGALWRGPRQDLGIHSFSPLLAWENFLSFGGRLGLAVFAGIATVLLAEWLTRIVLGANIRNRSAVVNH